MDANEPAPEGYRWLPNPRRDELLRARRATALARDHIGAALSEALAAMAGPEADRPWVGGTSGHFHDELLEADATARSGGRATWAAFDAAVRVEPDLVLRAIPGAGELNWAV